MRNRLGFMFGLLILVLLAVQIHPAPLPFPQCSKVGVSIAAESSPFDEGKALATKLGKKDESGIFVLEKERSGVMYVVIFNPSNDDVIFAASDGFIIRAVMRDEGKYIRAMLLMGQLIEREEIGADEANGIGKEILKQVVSDPEPDPGKMPRLEKTWYDRPRTAADRS